MKKSLLSVHGGWLYKCLWILGELLPAQCEGPLKLRPWEAVSGTPSPFKEGSSAFPGQNSPPVFEFKRDWLIRETEPVGTRITTVRTKDEEDDPIEYGLEPAVFLDGSSFFTINKRTGEVFLRSSLKGQAGNDYYLFVTANDGHQTAKIEVYVRVTEANGLETLQPAVEMPTYLSSRNGSRNRLLPLGGALARPVPPRQPPSNVTAVPAAPAASSQPMALLLPMLLLVALAPALLFGFWLLSRRYRHTKPKVQGKSISQEPAASDLTYLNRRHSERYEHTGDRWEIPRHQLHFLGLLGEGCFGQVWRCELNRGDQPPTLVAVKTLKENASEKERRDLLSELDIMKTLEPHPNVVSMVGCCTERAPIFVVMEFLALGTLQNYLRNQRRHGVTITSRDLTAFAHHIARGMAFLAQHGIVHRDLAARNVLVSENKVCKVADFGFARDLKGSLVYERKTEGRLPIRWMAPESLFDNIFTTKSDVWSFGILMWEIVTLGSTPYPGLGAADVMRKVHEGYRLEKPEHCKREVYNLMFYCWCAEPSKRPSFAELVESLDALLLSENDYIQLDRFPDHAYYNLGTTVPGEKV